MATSKRVSKLSGDQKKDLFWNSILSQSLSDLRGTLTSTGIEAHTRNEGTGRTSIMEAALKGKVKSLDCLLDWYERRRELRTKGWLDLKDDEGARTALMLASMEGHVDCVKSLIRYGANLHTKDGEGKNARDLAFGRKKTAVVEFIDETLRPPSEDEAVEEGADGQVLTSTQRSKLKKKELKAAEGAKPEPAASTSAATSTRTDRDKSIEPEWDEVAKLCESFDMLRAIHEVNVTKPSADSIDPALWSCHWLKLLRLKLGPDFKEIPGKELSKLSELQQLILSGNPNLTTLPDEIGSLRRLRVLELEGCGLSSLPSTIGQLTGLESLNASNNKLTTLNLEGCTALGLLNVSGNMLMELTLPYSQMTRLSEIRCSRNQIATLSPEIGSLSNLIIFEAEFNKIRELPIELIQLKKVKVFKLEGNPIADPKLAKLVKEGKGPKDLFSKLEKVEERSSGKNKKGKKQSAKAAEKEEEVEEETSDLDIDDDDI
jgi:hypothetical protein